MLEKFVLLTWCFFLGYGLSLRYCPELLVIQNCSQYILVQHCDTGFQKEEIALSALQLTQDKLLTRHQKSCKEFYQLGNFSAPQKLLVCVALHAFFRGMSPIVGGNYFGELSQVKVGADHLSSVHPHFLLLFATTQRQYINKQNKQNTDGIIKATCPPARDFSQNVVQIQEKILQQ